MSKVKLIGKNTVLAITLEIPSYIENNSRGLYIGDKRLEVQEYLSRFCKKIHHNGEAFMMRDFQWDIFQFHVNEYYEKFGGIIVY